MAVATETPSFQGKNPGLFVLGSPRVDGLEGSARIGIETIKEARQ